MSVLNAVFGAGHSFFVVAYPCMRHWGCIYYEYLASDSKLALGVVKYFWEAKVTMLHIVLFALKSISQPVLYQARPSALVGYVVQTAFGSQSRMSLRNERASKKQHGVVPGDHPGWNS